MTRIKCPKGEAEIPSHPKDGSMNIKEDSSIAVMNDSVSRRRSSVNGLGSSAMSLLSPLIELEILRFMLC